jgi:hypothetical protein
MRPFSGGYARRWVGARMSNGTSNTVRVVHIQMTSAAHVTIRNIHGRKLFEMNLTGVTVALTVPADAAVKVEPDEGSRQ